MSATHESCMNAQEVADLLRKAIDTIAALAETHADLMEET